MVLLAAMLAGLGLVLRSESLAHRLNSAARATLSLAAFVRRPTAHGPRPAAGLPGCAVGLLAARGRRITVTTAASQLTLWPVLLACLRGVGLSQARRPGRFPGRLRLRPGADRPSVTPVVWASSSPAWWAIMAVGTDHQVSVQVTAAVLLYRA